MLAGPKESSYYNIAGRYAKIIARSGVKVQVIETDGAQDNLRRLADRKIHPDVGFVLGGISDGIEIGGLISLGERVSSNRFWFSIAARKRWTACSS